VDLLITRAFLPGTRDIIGSHILSALLHFARPKREWVDYAMKTSVRKYTRVLG
jgi:hypothetical protein